MIKRLVGLFAIPIFLFSVSYTPGRAPIAPFINGDTFRAYCDFAYDEITTFNPALVKHGDRVFINGDLLANYFKLIHPRIRSKYILICHNTDHSIPRELRVFLDDEKLLAFFTQNQDETIHPKLHPLPIGIENRHWNFQNKEILTKIKEMRLPKIHLAYCNFNSGTFPEERNFVRDLFFHASFCLRSERKNFESYAYDIASSKFVISPRGNGLDTHRLWEALYVGSFPVVKTSSLDFLYEGLPVVIIKDWEAVTEDFLNKKYEEMKNKFFCLDKLYSDFWFNWIESYRKGLSDTPS
jgi:hypothetical protein